jgi:hypothetical protein
VAAEPALPHRLHRVDHPGHPAGADGGGSHDDGGGGRGDARALQETELLPVSLPAQRVAQRVLDGRGHGGPAPRHRSVCRLQRPLLCRRVGRGLGLPVDGQPLQARPQQLLRSASRPAPTTT